MHLPLFGSDDKTGWNLGWDNLGWEAELSLPEENIEIDKETEYTNFITEILKKIKKEEEETQTSIKGESFSLFPRANNFWAKRKSGNNMHYAQIREDGFLLDWTDTRF